MGILNILLLIILVLSGIATVLLVLMHSGKGTGLSEMLTSSIAPTGAGTGVIEKNLDRLTIITSAVFIVTVCIMALTFPVGTLG